MTVYVPGQTKAMQKPLASLILGDARRWKMLFERFSKLPDGSIIRRVEEQLQLMTWKTIDDQSSIRVLREWPRVDEQVGRVEAVALSARQRATYEQSKQADGALAAEGLSW